MPAAEFPQMSLSQMHDRLRLELLRRIQRGSLSISLLSRQTGFGPSHLSNFLHSKRRLSLEAMDRILAAQQMSPDDLLTVHGTRAWRDIDLSGIVPLVSHATAMHEPVVRPPAVQRLLHFPEELMRSARSRCGPGRKAWLRFVAIRAEAADAAAMRPLIFPDALMALDRHYNTLTQYHPEWPNLYAVRHESHLVVRFADFQAGRLVLRPHNRGAPVELMEMMGEESPGDFIVGRIVAVLNRF